MIGAGHDAVGHVHRPCGERVRVCREDRGGQKGEAAAVDRALHLIAHLIPIQHIGRRTPGQVHRAVDRLDGGRCGPGHRSGQWIQVVPGRLVDNVRIVHDVVPVGVGRGPIRPEVAQEVGLVIPDVRGAGIHALRDVGIVRVGGERVVIEHVEEEIVPVGVRRKIDGLRIVVGDLVGDETAVVHPAVQVHANPAGVACVIALREVVGADQVALQGVVVHVRHVDARGHPGVADLDVVGDLVPGDRRPGAVHHVETVDTAVIARRRVQGAVASDDVARDDDLRRGLDNHRVDVGPFAGQNDVVADIVGLHQGVMAIGQVNTVHVGAGVAAVHHGQGLVPADLVVHEHRPGVGERMNAVYAGVGVGGQGQGSVPRDNRRARCCPRIWISVLEVLNIPLDLHPAPGPVLLDGIGVSWTSFLLTIRGPSFQNRWPLRPAPLPPLYIVLLATIDHLIPVP